MRIASKTFVLGCLILGAAACGGSSSTGAARGSTTTTTGTGGSGPSVAMACADQAHAACEERDKCSPGFSNKKIYGDETTCETRVALACPGNLAAKGTAQTPAHIEACVAAYPSYACTDFFDGNPPAACIPPVGTLPMGAVCGASAQCTSTFCSVSQYATCGTCQPLPTVGTSCQIQVDCGRNLACAAAAGAASGTCAAFVASGGACLTGTSPCEAGLGCVGDDVVAKTMGKCQPQGKMGDACDGTRKTLANCDATLGVVCIPTAKGSAVGTCHPVTFAAAGAACGDIGAAPITGFAECEAGGACIKAAATDATGTCAAPAADGASCDSDPTKGPPCLPPAKCVPITDAATPGKCTVPDASKCM